MPVGSVLRRWLIVRCGLVISLIPGGIRSIGLLPMRIGLGVVRLGVGRMLVAMVRLLIRLMAGSVP